MALDPVVVADVLQEIWRLPPTEAQVSFYSTFDSVDAVVEEAVDDDAAIPVRTAITYYQVFYNRVPDEPGLDFWTQVVANGIAPNDLEDYFNDASEFETNNAGLSNLEIVTNLYRNVLGREPDLDGLNFWVNQVAVGNITIAQLGGFFARAPETATTFDPYIDAFLTHIVEGTQDFEGSLFDEIDGGVFTIETEQVGPQASMEMHTVEGAVEISNAPVDLDGGDGIDALRLIGNSDIRIDFTDPFEQVEQIDIDGDGINPGEIDYNVRPFVNVQNFEIIDAWARGNALLDPSNDTEGFTGNIDFDGTGFYGDGTSLNGNIVLAGAGDDIIKGGIGNDFLTGGAGTNLLQGGRNADFFYQELSSLDTELTGDSVIKGGTTFDDDPLQNFDWLLLEASDDEELIVVDLDADDNNGDPFSEGGLQGGGTVENGDITTGNAQAGVKLEDIENVNASGNFYGFLDVVAYGDAEIVATQFKFTTDNKAGPETGSGNEWAHVRSVTVTLDGVTLFAGPSVIDPETLPADSNAALGVIVDRLNAFYASLATDGNPANDAFANLVASQGISEAPGQEGRPELIITDNEARTFNNGQQGIGFGVSVDGNDTFEFNTSRDFEFDQDSASLFPDLYFGDFRDFTEGGAVPRIPGLSPGVTGQMEVFGSAAVNYIIAGFDNDTVYGLDGDDLLMGGDLEFLLTHQNNINLFDREGHFAANLVESVNSDGEEVLVGNDGRDTLIGGRGSDDIVLELDGGEIHGGANPADFNNDLTAFAALYLQDLFSGVDLSPLINLPELIDSLEDWVDDSDLDGPLVDDLFAILDGLGTKQEDTLWLTTFTTGRTNDVSVSTDGSLDERFILSALLGTVQDLEGVAEADAEAAALDAVTTDSVIYLDLGAQITNDITDIYPWLTSFQGYGADRLGTADQTSYREGFEAVTITGMDHIDASGLGRIDYLAAGTNDPELNFENQQNYRGTNSDLVLRGTDGLSIAILNQPEFLLTIEMDENNPLFGFLPDAGAIENPLDVFYALSFAPVIKSGNSDGTLFDVTDPLLLDDDVFNPETVGSAAYSREFQLLDFDNELIAGRGDDVLEGRGGTDRLSGREGDDTFEVSLHFNNFQEVIERGDGGPENGLAASLLSFIGGISDIELTRYVLDSFDAPVGPNGPAIPDGGFDDVVDYWGKQGDGVKFINRDLDLVDRLGNKQPDGLFLLDDASPKAGSQSDRIGQDFRAAPETNIAADTLFNVALTGVFADDNSWDKVINISLLGDANDRDIDIDTSGSTTVQDVVDKVNAAIADLADDPDPEVAALAGLLRAEVVNEDEFTVIGSPGAYNFTGATADTLEPDINQGEGDAGAQVTYETPRETIEGEDDELVFLSYQNRYDNEKTDSETFSLGRTAYAEDLVVKLGAEGTELVEGQQYRIDIGKLKDFDTVTLTLNGEVFSVTVGVDEVEGTVISETTAQAIGRLISQINAAVAADDDSAIGNLIVQGGLVVPGQDIVSFFIREGSEDQDVFLDVPVIEITNQSGGVRPEWSVSDLSNTHVSLTLYDGRSGQEGLNEGRDHTEQRGDGDLSENETDYSDRFITFEGKETEGDTIGVNRAILQTATETAAANAYNVLQGMDVAVFTAVDPDASSLGSAQDEILIDLGNHDAQWDISFADSPDRDGVPVYLRLTDPSDWPDDIGQPVVQTDDGDFTGLHGDDYLLGGDGNDSIDAGLGDDKVQASKDLGLGDILKGGENVVIDDSGEIQFNPDGTLLQKSDADDDGDPANNGLYLAKFNDRAIFDERLFRPTALGGTSFIMTVGAIAAAQGIDGTISSTYAIDEGGDGIIDDFGSLSEFEFVRTLNNVSDGTADTLNLVALSDDTQSGANLFGLGVFFDMDEGLLTADINDDGNFQDELVDGTDDTFYSFYQGFEEVFLGTGNDIVDGSGGNDTILGGAGNDTIGGDEGDDSIDGGAGNDFLDGDDGNDTILGASGNDDIEGGFGDDFIDGGAGNDTIDDIGGEDTILGGGGADLINDVATADSIDAGTGNDIVNLFGPNYNYFGNSGARPGAANPGQNQTVSGGADVDILNVVTGSGSGYQPTGAYPSGDSEYGVNGVVNQSAGKVELFETVFIDPNVLNERAVLPDPNGTIGIKAGEGGPVSGGDVFFIVDRRDFMATADVVFAQSANGSYGHDAFIAEGNIPGTGETGNDNISLNGLSFEDIAGSSVETTFTYTSGTGSSNGVVLGAGVPVIAIDGLEGNDTLTASSGNAGEIMIGGIGDDVLDGGDRRYVAGSGVEPTYGHMLFGGLGNDSITGSEGNDLFHGGKGNDTHQMLEFNGSALTGDGADVFVFDFDGVDNSPNQGQNANEQDADGFDTVTGFTPGDIDTLVLLMNQSSPDSPGQGTMLGYLQNSGSSLTFAADSSGNVDVTLAIDTDDNGIADAAITFNNYFTTSSVLPGPITVNAVTNAQIAAAFGVSATDDITGNDDDSGLDNGDTIVVHNITQTQFAGLFGTIIYEQDFQQNVNPFEFAPYDPLVDAFN